METIRILVVATNDPDNEQDRRQRVSTAERAETKKRILVSENENRMTQVKMEPTSRVELPTSSLPKRCSTTELCGHG